MMGFSILVIFGLLTTSLVSSSSRYWIDSETSFQPSRFRAFRFTPKIFTSPENVKLSEELENDSEELKPMFKRAAFIKRRGRELFGKRSAPDFDGDMMVDARYRRRANELFGRK
ncbi:unnamed protein product [Caenorhabditis angaria]|uniref:Uncharacterized protein n=1 Tax=Caenorhabditis angaria TaxID=860376 RepID=A0A9P1INK9_9PELO|nr:unnamed protein product [Caenorhabditis angaria]